jgi:NAD(P)H dehydrogenase (quinone)
LKKPTILVTGATGRHGGTGPHVVRLLCEQQFHVRAMVRQLDVRSDHLRALGAEVVLGDFLSITSLRSVMGNVDHVYFSYPIDARHLEAATNVAVVARECGVHGLVNNSLMPARADHSSPEARQHWLAERIVDWADVGAVHIRGAFFYENLIRWTAESVASMGEIHLPFGDGEGKVSWVAAEDIAQVAAAILCDPAPHRGQTYNVTGPDILTYHEIAALFSRVLRRPVVYVDIPLQQWQKELLELEGPSPHLIEHLSCLAREFKRRGPAGGIRTNVVQKITGSEPKSLEMYVSKHVDALSAFSRQAKHL